MGNVVPVRAQIENPLPDKLLQEIAQLILDKASGFVQVNISEGRLVSLKVDRTIKLT